MWSGCFYLCDLDTGEAVAWGSGKSEQEERVAVRHREAPVTKRFPTSVGAGKTTWSATSLTVEAETLVRH
jgi:hypothetical protein